MIEATDFRDAMSLLPTAVNVITTKGDSGCHGFTASAVCSVTDTPPTLLVCMNQSSRSHEHFLENKTLSVNVLGTQHEPISNAFASKLCSEERFCHGAWTTLTTGAPVLEDALVSFDCEIEDRKSTRLNSSHVKISYAVFCLKKKKKHRTNENIR